MTSKQKVLEVFPDAKAVWRTAGKYPKFPRRMIQSAPRHHFIRKKYARHLKGKWRYVEIYIPSLRDMDKVNTLFVGDSEVDGWQRVAEWYWVESKGADK